MCGIAGVVALNHKTIELINTVKMLDSLSHRGPDDAGYLYFHTGTKHRGHSFHLNLSDKKFSKLSPLLPTIQEEAVQRELCQHDWDIFFGHRRLAILDLTDAGHQPMSDLSKNIWVVYNGEIYNFKEIRAELEKAGHKFKSNTDTEVIIYAYIEWGIKCIEKFNGMFAFALYDNFQKKFYLVRDRYGIKPLYYSIVKEPNGHSLIFGSEIKAICRYANYSDIDLDGTVEYLSFQNFFSDRTLWKDIKILLAGHYIEIDLKKQEKGSFCVSSSHKNLLTMVSDLDNVFRESKLKANLIQYWDFQPFQDKFKEKESDILKNLEDIFEKAVKRQLISDVEIGSYLSGGIDSGAITAIASKHFINTKGSFKSFTIGFDLHSASGIELSFDERERAEYMSYIFGTEHYEMVLKAGDMERCLSSLVYYLEEPRVGQSYPNYYANMLASKFVKVVLTGSGGDELFGGYPWRYSYVLNTKNFDDFVDNYFRFWVRLFPLDVLDKAFIPIKGKYTVEPRTLFASVIPDSYRKEEYTPEEALELALYFEQKTFLHGILVVEDKLSMAHSLETRVPFLDNELVDFALKIPINLKLKNISKYKNANENEVKKIRKTNDGKVILRKILKKYVPKEIFNAKKQGFSAPDNSWFKGESINLIKRVLLKKNLKIHNFIDENILKKMILEHINGKANRRLLLWSSINLELLLNSKGL